MTHNANIYTHNDSLHVEIGAGYGDFIELRTCGDLLELLRDLIAVGNAHFGTTARLVEAGGDDAANHGTYYEVTGDAPYRDPAEMAVLCEQKLLDHFGIVAADEVRNREFIVDSCRALASDPTPTWAEYQAANKIALDEIADFVGGTR